MAFTIEAVPSWTGPRQFEGAAAQKVREGVPGSKIRFNQTLAVPEASFTWMLCAAALWRLIGFD
jgi:hypothetical protein